MLPPPLFNNFALISLTLMGSPFVTKLFPAAPFTHVFNLPTATPFFNAEFLTLRLFSLV